jgi:hypothetical protein
MADEDLPQAERQQIVENTYQLKPADDEKFRAADVRRMMASLLDERLKGKKYDAGQCNQLSKDLCTDIKSRVKGESHAHTFGHCSPDSASYIEMGGAARHKIVVQVTIGEVHGQGVRIASRCLWDTETDNHASSTFQNPYLYCVAMVFAVYFEVRQPYFNSVFDMLTRYLQ